MCRGRVWTEGGPFSSFLSLAATAVWSIMDMPPGSRIFLLSKKGLCPAAPELAGCEDLKRGWKRIDTAIAWVRKLSRAAPLMRSHRLCQFRPFYKGQESSWVNCIVAYLSWREVHSHINSACLTGVMWSRLAVSNIFFSGLPILGSHVAATFQSGWIRRFQVVVVWCAYGYNLFRYSLHTQSELTPAFADW